MVDKKRNVEDWVRLAKEIGFSHAGPLDPKTLKTENWVRETCSSDKCHFIPVYRLQGLYENGRGA